MNQTETLVCKQIRTRPSLGRKILQYFREADLLARIKLHDARAMKNLYEQYETPLYNLVLPIVKNPEEAKDVIQELFIQVWEKADKYDFAKGDVYAWLQASARNKAIDRTRSKHFRQGDQQLREEVIEKFPDSAEASPFQVVVTREKADALQKALEQLPSPQREILRQAYWAGLTQREMTLHFQLPLGTVKTRMRQGLKKMQQILAKMFDGGDGLMSD